MRREKKGGRIEKIKDTYEKVQQRVSGLTSDFLP